MSQKITRPPAARGAVEPAPLRPRELSKAQKAAIIVRLLISEGETLPLAKLPEDIQTALTQEIGALRVVDRETLETVVREFVADLEAVGLAFPGELGKAIDLMDGHISTTAADRLRRMADRSLGADPWERIGSLPPDYLLGILQEESLEIAAVLISKVPVSKGAELLSRLPGERARRLAHAVSLTDRIDPETVRKIGSALVMQLSEKPRKAFNADSATRVGALLNQAPAATRDSLLDGLEAEDAHFAEQVRKAIFTFVHIPARVSPRDVPVLVRNVDQPTLITALAACTTRETLATREFIMNNISQRLAETLLEDIMALGKVREKKGEEAMAAIIATIRDLEAKGDINLIVPEDEE
jgi:flagellar motor switch protein FliG